MVQVEFFAAGRFHREVLTDRETDNYITRLRKVGATLIVLREYTRGIGAHGIAWLAS